ncbi:MAG: hypothetical protein V4468_17530 [Pseudomonadota bacterium]
MHLRIMQQARPGVNIPLRLSAQAHAANILEIRRRGVQRQESLHGKGKAPA